MFNGVFAKKDGSYEVASDFYMLGRLGDLIILPDEVEMIPMPEGATLTMMPSRYGIFMNEDEEFFEYSIDDEGEEVWALAALLPQGFTRTLIPATRDIGDELPLLGYTAVGSRDGELYVAAVQTDEHYKWHPNNYNTADLGKLIIDRKIEFPGNKIITQLALCAKEYGCFTAQNIMYRRFEGGIPVSPVCNADCVGCISLQVSECCPSPQQRIKEAPTVDEVVEIILAHLQADKENIISFGQGCEGEPSLEGDLISSAIKAVRAKTSDGTINMNSNGGSFSNMQKIIDAGIDSLRISMISAVRATYEIYHRPMNFTFDDVYKTLTYAKEKGVWVSLNLLAYPGLNDKEEEIDALANLIDECGIKQIQFRNLNIDPMKMKELYGEYLNESWGVCQMIEALKMTFPDLELSNYSKPIAK